MSLLDVKASVATLRTQILGAVYDLEPSVASPPLRRRRASPPLQRRRAIPRPVPLRRPPSAAPIHVRRSIAVRRGMARGGPCGAPRLFAVLRAILRSGRGLAGIAVRRGTKMSAGRPMRGAGTLLGRGARC